MANRLGKALHGIGAALSLGILSITALCQFATADQFEQTPNYALHMWLFYGVIAAVIYGAGWSCRYVLGGEAK